MGELKFWVFVVIFAFIGILYIINFFIKRKESKLHSNRVEYLLKNGKKIEIDLIKSMIKIREVELVEETKEGKTFRELYDDGLLGEDTNTVVKKEYISYVLLEFFDNGKPYYHEIKLNMPAETVRKLFIFQKKTSVYYDLSNPENCIVDLGFAT